MATLKKSGFILKLGGGAFSAWQKRWFVLDPIAGSLTYYKQQKDKEPAGSIILTGCSIRESDMRPNAFAIGAAKKEYQLACESAEERAMWMKSILGVQGVGVGAGGGGGGGGVGGGGGGGSSGVHDVDGGVAGMLSKKGGMGNLVFQQRYCTLKGSTFRYYRSEEDKDPAGELEMKYTVWRHDTEEATPFSFVLESPSKTWLFCASSDAEMEEWKSYLKKAGCKIIEQVTALGDAMHSGWLDKRGGAGKSMVYQRRFCRIDDKTMRYYKNEEDKVGGEIDLDCATIIMMGEDQFAVDIESRRFQFQALTQEDFIAWTNALTRVGCAVVEGAGHAGEVDPTSGEFCGWLLKQGGEKGNKGWKKRWFCLKKDVLYYFKDQSDYEPQGCIHLRDSTVRSAEEEIKKANAFAVMTLSRRTFFLAAENTGDFDMWLDFLGKAGCMKRKTLKEFMKSEMEATKEKSAKKEAVVAAPAVALASTGDDSEESIEADMELMEPLDEQRSALLAAKYPLDRTRVLIQQYEELIPHLKSDRVRLKARFWADTLTKKINS